jgi:hypothetical protein
MKRTNFKPDYIHSYDQSGHDVKDFVPPQLPDMGRKQRRQLFFCASGFLLLCLNLAQSHSAPPKILMYMVATSIYASVHTAINPCLSPGQTKANLLSWMARLATLHVLLLWTWLTSHPLISLISTMHSFLETVLAAASLASAVPVERQVSLRGWQWQICYRGSVAFRIAICLVSSLDSMNPAEYNILAVIYFGLAPLYLYLALHETRVLYGAFQSWRDRGAGIEFLRMCTSVEKNLLERVHESSMASVTYSSDSIYWVNLYLGGDFPIAFPEQQEFLAWVHRIVKETYATPVDVSSVGFLISPARNKGQHQPWHYDYPASSSNIFIPLTALTEKNATQFVRGRRLTLNPSDATFPGTRTLLAEHSDPAHPKQLLEVSQVVAEPFSVFKMYPTTMHRGVPNTEDHDRHVLFIFVSPPEENSWT